MKRKIFSRVILVPCVIILFLTTPIIKNIVAEENVYNDNYLDKIAVYHNPAIYRRSPLFSVYYY